MSDNIMEASLSCTETEKDHKRKGEDEKEKKGNPKKEERGISEVEEVKSAAIVKYSSVEAPATFTRLQCNTNLNLPPSNWLSSSAESYGLRAASFFHRSGFSSFKMAHMFPDCVGEVDVVSDAENIKKLLKIPYSHSPVSMMIHRIENTLLIDEFDVHKYLLREAECQWEWFKKFFVENVMQSAGAKEKLVCHRDNSRNALQQKSLVSKFLYHSLVVADPTKSKIEKSGVEPESIDPSIPIPLPYKHNPPLPDPTLEEELPDPTSNHNFARNVVWTFEDIQMLLGTDMPIFGGKTHPCISLRLRDMTKPINVLTGMDYWLDNLMCNVPEVVMCYHLNGIVQKYELIKTEDLPNLENSKFSPKVIRDIAQNILSFLKSNATKAGHTYWLFKGKDDDVVKLYDLTSLCTDVMDEKGQTPFTVPVAMLLYRVARNMMNSSDGQPQAATIRMLLKNCVSLLSEEKYPEIVTSAHYMLADLYIPADINPVSPQLFSNGDVGNEGTNEEKQREEEDTKSEDMAIKSMSLANISEIHMDDAEFITPPPPLGTDVEGRCKDAMSHVLQGLKSLKFLTESDEKKEGLPTNLEEEEPTMAKPFQTIPMPYQPLDTGNEDEKKGGKKKNKKKKKDSKISEESSRSLLCKPKAEAIPTWRPPTPKNTSSWNIHLKTLLFDKMCLIYATLLEKFYSEGRFGLALHNIKMVLKVRKVLKSLRSNLCKDGVDSYLLGRAGDAFFMVVQNSQKLESFDKDYCSSTDYDREALKELKAEGVSNVKEKGKGAEDEGERFPRRLENIEVLLLASNQCYKKALEADDPSVANETLIRRLGNIQNELGVYYMNQAATLYQEEMMSKSDRDHNLKYKELFNKSQGFLEAGIKAFDSIKDEANLALLYSNTGRLLRVQAHFSSPSDDDRKELLNQDKYWYKKSISYYQKALQVLGERKFNPPIWDSVNWELSTTLFSLATLLQDNSTFIKSKEEAEREVIETLHKALKYCDVETAGPRQPVYQFRSAMIHHRLASLYHKSYRTSSEDEGKRKKVIQLCKLHYEKASKLLLQLENSVEFLRVQLERVALAEFQAEGASSVTGKIKHYESALELLVESDSVLKMVSERDLKYYEEDKLPPKTSEENGVKDDTEEDAGEKTELEHELILLGFFEQRLQFNLLSLTKLYMARCDSKKGSANHVEAYKKLYALTLRSNFSRNDPVNFAKSLLSIISSVAENMALVSNVS